MEIQDPSHAHPLLLREEYDPQVTCKICSGDLWLSKFNYACRDNCKYYVHFLCALPLLNEIYHPFHPQHPLSFEAEARPVRSANFQCQMCNKYNPSYSCDGCRFGLDLHCALKTPTITCEYRFLTGSQPSCHKQPLEVVEVEKYGVDQVKTKCYICELSLSSGSSSQAYICKICKYFFHKSCIELRPRIRHPIHIRHCLDLKIADEDKSKCNLCDKKVRFNYIFSCSNRSCMFYVCLQCLSLRPTSMRPTVMYQGHDHDLLYLVDRVAKDENIKCWNPFNTSCKHSVVSSKDFTHTQRYMFCCDKCNFNLHFLCGPLPCVIKHNCHLHPLTLIDSMVEDDLGEYYCDACETERDPRICVYYCGECKYIAHIHCVISEVVLVLQNNHGDVDLRIVGQRKLLTEMVHHNNVEIENNRTIEGPKEEEEEEEEEEEDEEEEEEVEKISEGPSKPKRLLNIILSVAKKDFDDVDDSKDPKVEEEDIEELKEIGKDGDKRYLLACFIMDSLTRKKQGVKGQRTGAENHFSGKRKDPEEEVTKSTKVVEQGRQEQAEQEGQEQDEIDEIFQEFSSYTLPSLEQLINKLKSLDSPTTWNKVNSAELRLKLVNVGGYMITWNLAHALEDLLSKHGDISDVDEKICSPTFKNLVFFILCRLLYRMSKIMVVDLTEDILGDWYSCLRFVTSKGFRVHFIYDGLERIVRAYKFVERNRVKHVIKTKIDKKISDLQHHVKALQWKLVNSEAKLKKYKEYRDVYEKHGIFKSHPSSKTANYSREEDLDEEASKLKWKYAVDCFF